MWILLSVSVSSITAPAGACDVMLDSSNLEHIFPSSIGLHSPVSVGALGLLVAKQEQFRPGGYTRPILP